ncbi:hypothetical protein KA078_04010 [Candidatus Woesebacteria bacterium]|nr:hypothetical protein [Candidatus Woesebacteria bacterium]
MSHERENRGRWRDGQRHQNRQSPRHENKIERTKRINKEQEQKQREKDAQRAESHKNNERGATSEKDLRKYLENEALFPWIHTVIKAKECQPGYDYVIKICTDHPLHAHLQEDTLYVDAKSSTSGVYSYFEEQAERFRINKQRVIQDKKRLAINAGPKASEAEMDLQVVLQLLIFCNALGDEAKTQEVLQCFDERLRKAYQAEVTMVAEYILRYIGPT